MGKSLPRLIAVFGMAGVRHDVRVLNSRGMLMAARIGGGSQEIFTQRAGLSRGRYLAEISVEGLSRHVAPLIIGW